MAVSLRPHQLDAIDKLGNGKILCGEVGTGKSRVAVGYYFMKVCEGVVPVNGKGKFLPMTHPRDLYIITTAKKRDSMEWRSECAPFGLSEDRETSFQGCKVTIDSWNNISKYKDVYGAFFIFDEQRLVGSGAWVKAFLDIARKNKWILLSATPGDTWMDYVPVFVANGFYRNKTEFVKHHVVFSRFSKFPKVERFVETGILERYRRRLLVDMPYERHTVRHSLNQIVRYDKDAWDTVVKKRWHIYEDRPIKDVSELFVCMRRLVNTDPTRIETLEKIWADRRKIIVFYNYDYELELLRDFQFKLPPWVKFAEWNGHKHEPVPEGDDWVYLVQYTAGAEGWNCTTTDTIVFYSLNYSWRVMEQAKGRIDRLNTPYTDLWYYVLRSGSPIDAAILRALRDKKTFNERVTGRKMWGDELPWAA